MTPNMLIELIRRVEDSPGFTLNIQQFTTSLLHRFKQDGIIREYFPQTKFNFRERRHAIFNFPSQNVSIKARTVERNQLGL